MAVEWIQYKGHKILYSSYQGLKHEEETAKVLDEQMSIIAASTDPVLLLVNLEGAHMTPESTQRTKELLGKLHTKITKIALVGVTGLKSIIVQSIGRETGETPQGMFPTLDEAKDWLVS